MTRYMYVMSGVQILSVINMKLQAVRLGTARIYFLKKERILSTVLHVEGWLTSRIKEVFS